MLHARLYLSQFGPVMLVVPALGKKQKKNSDPASLFLRNVLVSSLITLTSYFVNETGKVSLSFRCNLNATFIVAMGDSWVQIDGQCSQNRFELCSGLHSAVGLSFYLYIIK